MEITFRKTTDGGAFVIERDSALVAEITWLDTQSGTLIAGHTFVDDSLRGQGIARQLAVKLADYARENGFKIRPDCSYVRAFLERETTYSDLIYHE